MNKTATTLEHRTTLRDEVTEILRREIITNDLQPGEKISEADLSKRLGVSRTPIRESFCMLAAEGFLTIEPRKGVRVAELNPDDINNYYEIRKILEGYAARKATRTAGTGEINRLKKLNRRFLRLLEARYCSGMGLVLAHNNFHEYIVKLGNNHRMLEIYADLGQRCLRYRFMATATISSNDIKHDHEKIIEAIRNGDADGAEKAVHFNADRGLQALMEILQTQGKLNLGRVA